MGGENFLVITAFSCWYFWAIYPRVYIPFLEIFFPRTIYKFLFFFLFCSGVFSKCTQSSDGLEVTCESTFAGQREKYTIKLETCREKPKLKFNIKIDALYIDWTETFEDSKEAAIPGFSYAGLMGVYLKVQLKSYENGFTNIKVGKEKGAIFVS